MAKVFGMHMIELHPGVKAEDFEKFIVDEVYPATTFDGWNYYLLKGDRGERAGKYLMMVEIDSIEARDRIYPSPNEASEEAMKFHQAQAAALEKWATLATPMNADSTDYVVVGK